MAEALRSAVAGLRGGDRASRDSTAKVAGISSAAVGRAPGKPWAPWLGALDRAGASNMAYKDIAVGYEQARAGREAHQTACGFSGGAGKTTGATPAQIVRAWTNARTRAACLPDAVLTIRKSTPSKNVRVIWTRPGARKASAPRITSVEVWITDRSNPGAPKRAVQMQESKPRSRAEIAEPKKHWSAAPGRLAESIE